MGIYVKSYKSRVCGVLISVLSIVLAVLIWSLMFGNKTKRINSQLSSYSRSGYSFIYKLNYPLGVDDEYIYADSNIFVYADDNRTTRIPAVVLMQNTSSSYDASTLGFSNTLRSDQIVLARNIADEYHLIVGDRIYALYPYSNELVSLTLVAITDVNYDFENPDVDNNIGIAILGFNEQYSTNSENKSICFSSESLSKEISNHPQILDSIYNKASNNGYVFSQGLYMLILEAVMIIAAVAASEFFFYRYSHKILRRMYLKGMTRNNLKAIPFFEHIVMTVIPMLITIIARSIYIPIISSYAVALYVIDVAITVVYSLIFGLQPSKRLCYRVR